MAGVAGMSCRRRCDRLFSPLAREQYAALARMRWRHVPQWHALYQGRIGAGREYCHDRCCTR